MPIIHLSLVAAVLLGASPPEAAPLHAYRRVRNMAEEESYEPRTFEPTRADIERRVAAVRFNFPKVDAAVAVVDRAIPAVFTSTRIRILALTAARSEGKASSALEAARIRSARRGLVDSNHLDALRDPRVRRALLYLASTGIFADDRESTARTPRGFREPRDNE